MSLGGQLPTLTPGSTASVLGSHPSSALSSLRPTACRWVRPNGSWWRHPAPPPPPRPPPLIYMGLTTFPIMKYSQVTGSLRNDGGQSIAFQRVIFSPSNGRRGVLTVISAAGRPDRSASVTLVRQSHSLAARPPFLFLLLWRRPASSRLAWRVIGWLFLRDGLGFDSAPPLSLIGGREKPMEIKPQLW